MVVVALCCTRQSRGRTDERTDRWTDRRYQVHYLPVSLSYAVDEYTIYFIVCKQMLTAASALWILALEHSRKKQTKTIKLGENPHSFLSLIHPTCPVKHLAYWTVIRFSTIRVTSPCSKCTLTFSTRRVSTELFWPKVKEKYRASKFSRFQCIFNYSLFKVFKSTQVGAVASGPHGHPMSSGRALEVQHLECPSFLLHLHFWKCALLLHVFKMKCNIGMKRGTRSKMMCKIRAHFPPIWAWAAVVRKPSLIIVKHFYFFNLTIAEWGLFWPFNDWHFND